MIQVYFVKNNLADDDFDICFDYDGPHGDTFDTFIDYSISIIGTLFFIYQNGLLLTIANNYSDLNDKFLYFMKHEINNESTIDKNISAEDIGIMPEDEYNKEYKYNKITGKIITDNE